VIKEAAQASDSSEAEIIRLAIHRAAMSHRRWSEPMNAPRFASGDPTLANRVDEVLGEAFGGQAA
jgi:hypothetical protein